MSYTAPYFVFLHAARASGATVTVSPAANASFPAFYAYDGRSQSLFKFGSSSSAAYFQVDRGAAGLEAVDLLVIPSGHNLGAQTVTVKSSTTGAYAGEEVTIASFTSAAGLIQQALTSSTARYLRVGFGGTGTWELGEVWLGRKRQPSQGLGNAWRLALQPNYQRVQFDSGVTGGNQIGPSRTTFYAPFSPISGSDYTILKDLRDAVKDGQRFWMQVPDSSIPLTLFELVTPMTFQQINTVPGNATGPVYTTILDAIEAIG